MMQLPFALDLSGKVAVVTGGGGVLCGMMAKAIAASGAKVAILDLRAENAQIKHQQWSHNRCKQC